MIQADCSSLDSPLSFILDQLWYYPLVARGRAQVLRTQGAVIQCDLRTYGHCWTPTYAAMQIPYPFHPPSRLVVYLSGMARLWRVGLCPIRTSILVDVVSAPTSSIISPPVALPHAIALLWRDSLCEE